MTALLARLRGVYAVTGGAAFDPASLFASGEQGAWYDPSDLTTMWTDTAGTTQATVGDAVARIDDKSGNGNHATQATLAHRPILRQSGSLYYLEFDGAGDYLAAPTPGIDLTNLMMAGAFEQLDNADYAGFINLAPSSGNDYQASNAFFMQSSGVNDNPNGNIVVFNIEIRLATGSRTTPTELGVYLAQKDATTSFLNKNGVQVATDNSFSALINAPHTGDLLLGARFYAAGPSSFAYMNFYGCVIVDRTLVAQEISDTETYLADRSGVTL